MIRHFVSREHFDHHLKAEHGQTKIAEYLKEIMYGGIDGIVTTFAVVAGLAGANSGEVVAFSFVSVLLFGLANLFADASSMGLGEFLSARSDQKLYAKIKDMERHLINHKTDYEKAETKFLLIEKGFSEQDASTITNLYSKNPDYWTEFMMNHELGIPNHEDERPGLNAIATFIAFLIFGLIPLIPFLLTRGTSDVFVYSIGATFVALVLLGLLRSRITHEKSWRALIEVVGLGSVSAIIAFLVGTLFKV